MPYLTPKERIALDYATQWHEGQQRFSGAPYIVHPRRVGFMAKAYGFRQAMVCAAFLHDVVEDTAVTADDLTLVFGAEVADLVTELTTPKRGDGKSREDRFRAEYERLLGISVPAKLVKLCDVYDNISRLDAEAVGAPPQWVPNYVRLKARLLPTLEVTNQPVWETTRALLERAYRSQFGRPLPEALPR